MENVNNKNHSGRIISGVIIVFIGFAFLLKNMNLNIPHWIFSWHTLLIIIGLFVGAKHNFRGVRWLIMVLIGAYFTLDDISGLDFNISRYALGLGLVILGGFLILRPKDGLKRNSRFRDHFNDPTTDPNTNQPDSSNINSNDVIDVMAVFGGSHQVVYSKNFMGGEVTAVFGGADINLAQSDFKESVILDVTAVFGGIKLIIPQNWAVKSNVTAVFGSVEDKRGGMVPQGEIQKIVVLEGMAMFGGVEIKSF